MTRQAISGATTFIMAISVFAALLPALSMRSAANNVNRRAWSISIRESAIHSRITPWRASAWPKATRAWVRSHMSSSARSASPTRPHAVVDAPGAEASLRDLEAAALAQQQVLRRHAHVREVDLEMAVRRVVVAVDGQRPHQRDARRPTRHQDHGLLLVARGIGVGLAHEDEDRATRITRAGGPPLAAVQHVVIAVTLDPGLDVGGVGGGNGRLGHGEGGADAPLQQRLQPFGALGRRAVPGQHLHVAGIGGAAVEHLGRDGRAAHDLAQGRVFEIGEPGAIPALGQEQVPQAPRPAPRPSSRPSRAGIPSGRPGPRAGPRTRPRSDRPPRP